MIDIFQLFVMQLCVWLQDLSLSINLWLTWDLELLYVVFLMPCVNLSIQRFTIVNQIFVLSALSQLLCEFYADLCCLQMFMFGTTALEQFMDRLIEWPQYCNHILQISHLRATHAELVAAIERMLAKISSSQNEPNVGSMLSADQHGSSSIGNMEVYLHPSQAGKL